MNIKQLAREELLINDIQYVLGRSDVTNRYLKEEITNSYADNLIAVPIGEDTVKLTSYTSPSRDMTLVEIGIITDDEGLIDTAHYVYDSRGGRVEHNGDVRDMTVWERDSKWMYYGQLDNGDIQPIYIIDPLSIDEAEVFLDNNWITLGKDEYVARSIVRYQVGDNVIINDTVSGGVRGSDDNTDPSYFVKTYGNQPEILECHWTELRVDNNYTN